MSQMLNRNFLYLAAMAFISPSWAVDRYTIQPIDLPTVQGCATQTVNAAVPILLLNERGQVAGPLGSCAFLWQQGVVTVLGEHQPNVESRVVALNNNGQLVFNSTTYGADEKAQNTRAFLWDKARTKELGTLGTNTSASDINAYSQVVGISNNHAFLWRDGVMTDLVAETAYENQWNTATGINDQGQVLIRSGINTTTLKPGFTPAFSESSRPLVWENGVLNELEAIPFSFYNIVFFGNAFDINNAGFILGSIRNYSLMDDGAYYSLVLWRPDHTLEFPQAALTYGYIFYGLPAKINDLNQIVYFSHHQVDENYLSVSFDGLAFASVPEGNKANMPISADINDQGQIVWSGRYEDYTQGFFKSLLKAFIYQEGIAFELNELIPVNSGWTVEQVYAINNAGQILVSGNKGYALLTPGVPLQTGVCDVNQDGKVDIHDLSVLYTAQKNVSPAYDVNGDGIVNINDLRKCVTQCTSPKCAI